jgi:hypothetical protein
MFYFITPLHFQNYTALFIHERIKRPIKHWWNDIHKVKPKCPGETPVPLTICPSQIIHGISEVSPRTALVFFHVEKLKLLSSKEIFFVFSMGRQPLLGPGRSLYRGFTTHLN